MTTLTYTNTLVAGTVENVTAVQQNFVDARTVLNGNIDGDNMTAATKNAIALSDTSVIRRGKSIIATSETIAGTSYATLTTPDRISSLVVPTNAVVWVSYWCAVNKSAGATTDTFAAGLFFGANEVRSRFGVAAAGVSGGLMEAAGVTSGTAAPLLTNVFTDYTDAGWNTLSSAATLPVDDTTNGHPVGAFIPITIAAGTYTLEVRFKKLAGATCAVSARRFYAKVEAY